MKTNKRKRGFTIVELVIVIAVIAILAAVLIPTFSGLVEEARQSNDQQLVYHLNEAVKMVEVDRVKAGKTAKADTMHETLVGIDGKGFDVTKLTPTSKGDIIWDSTTNRFALIDKDGNVVYRDETVAEPSSKKEDLWKVYKSTDEIDNKYSVYLNNADATTASVDGVGFDAGYNTKLTSVNYTGDDGHNVVIRTNSADTTLTVNASADSVKHYGILGKLVLTDIAYDCFYEYGKTAYAEATKGKIVAKEGGTIQVLFATAAAVAAVEDGGTIGNAYCVSTSADEALESGYNNFSNSKAGNVEFKYVDSNSNPITAQSVEVIASASQDELKIEEIEESGLYEVRIGTTGYETIENARAASHSGDTIVLLKDITLGVDDSCIGWEKEHFSLDLNGYTMKTISEKGVTLNNNGYTSGVFYMDEFLEPVSISGGSIISKYGTAIYIAGNTASNIVTIENVIATNEQYANQGGAPSYASALRVTSEGHVLIKSGTFSGYNAVDLGSGGKADTCTIEGGTFIGRLTVNSANAQLIIKGGTFDHDPSAFVPSGYHATNNGNGTWTVSAD